MTRTELEVEDSCSNVCADLGLENAEELSAHGMIGYHVIQLLKDQKLKHREMPNLLVDWRPSAGYESDVSAIRLK